MSTITSLGKYLFAIPMMIFGFFHMMGAQQMAGMVPIPGGVLWVYITGLALIAAGIAILIGKYDKLAAVLLALLLLIFALSIHLVAVIGGDMPTNLLKDLALAGGALMYAHGLARDPSVIG